MKNDNTNNVSALAKYSKQNNVGVGANNVSKAAKAITIKQVINNVSGSPGGS